MRVYTERHDSPPLKFSQKFVLGKYRQQMGQSIQGAVIKQELPSPQMATVVTKKQCFVATSICFLPQHPRLRPLWEQQEAHL